MTTNSRSGASCTTRLSAGAGASAPTASLRCCAIASASPTRTSFSARERFLKDNSFRPDTPIHFANHHEAHALAALFYTDWNDALVYTSDGIGDNVSYSMRGLKNGKLECHYGDDRWLTRTLKETGLASAYGYATVACGFRMLRHEGKLTGLAAYGEPKSAPRWRRSFGSMPRRD